MQKIVRALIKNKDGKILLIKHTKKDFWVLPGGHIEKNEDEYKALKRELKEEFNVKINIIGEKKGLKTEGIKEKVLPICIYKISYINTKNKLEKRFEYIFQAEIKDSIIKTKMDEIDEFKWFTSKELKDLENIYPQIKELI